MNEDDGDRKEPGDSPPLPRIPPAASSSSSLLPPLSPSPFSASFTEGIVVADDDDEDDEENFNSTESVHFSPTRSRFLIASSSPLSFKRRRQQLERQQHQGHQRAGQTQKPLSRLFSSLHSPAKPQQKAQPRPTIRIPAPYDPDEYDLQEFNTLRPGSNEQGEDVTEQGYAKQVLTDWVAEGGVGARKYDDLTAIGILTPKFPR